jgi:hypothetical protein
MRAWSEGIMACKDLQDGDRVPARVEGDWHGIVAFRWLALPPRAGDDAESIRPEESPWRRFWRVLTNK